jgi:hypothetical protein
MRIIWCHFILHYYACILEMMLFLFCFYFGIFWSLIFYWNAPSGFFGEVFRGIWNGTDVAIKLFLEQDLTTENMEDFCNEIYILRYQKYFVPFFSVVAFFFHDIYTNCGNLILSFQPVTTPKW